MPEPFNDFATRGRVTLELTPGVSCELMRVRQAMAVVCVARLPSPQSDDNST
jgi:hypothetical protein